MIVVVEKYARRIEAVDMRVLTKAVGRQQISGMIETLELSIFNSAYRSLATLLSRKRRSTEHGAIAFKTPPQQTTIPEDPNRTRGSHTSGKSSSSTESMPEPNAYNFANEFFTATCTTVGRWMEGLLWVNPVPQLYLEKQYVLLYFWS